MSQYDYDAFLTKIYDYSPYFGKERRERDYATNFYLDAISNIHERILEFGSCTGLLTIPLARANHEIDSVDISPFMHECIRDKLCSEADCVGRNIQLYVCDAFDYQSDHRYSAIVLPDSILCAMPDKQKQIRLLKKCNSLLCNDGIIAFDIFQPWKDIIELKEKHQCSRFRLKDGELYIVYTHHLVDQEQQLHCFDFTHELIGGKPIQYHHTITYRYLFEDELVEMLGECGFKVCYIDRQFNFGKNLSIIGHKK